MSEQLRAVWISTDEGRGFCLQRLSDGQRLAWRNLPKSQGLRSLNVVGERFRLEDLQNEAFTSGRPLALVLEPENPADPDAVAVWDFGRGVQAGYLPRDECGIIAKRLRSGQPLRCYAMWETYRSGRREELRVLIVEQGAPLAIPPDPSHPLYVEYDSSSAHPSMQKGAARR